MRVSICIGSACHLKGSREVIQKLQKLVSENHLDSEVDLNGDFCSGNCRKGVCDDRRRTVFRKTGDNRRIFPEGDSGTPERVIVYI